MSKDASKKIELQIIARPPDLIGFQKSDEAIAKTAAASKKVEREAKKTAEAIRSVPRVKTK